MRCRAILTILLALGGDFALGQDVPSAVLPHPIAPGTEYQTLAAPAPMQQPPHLQPLPDGDRFNEAKAELEQKRKQRDALDREIRQLEQLTGPQQILVQVKMVEVSPTKLCALGVDWARVGESGDVAINKVSGIDSVSGLIAADGGSVNDGKIANSETFSFEVVDDDHSFFGILEALQQNNIARILAEPKMVVMSGRPASLHVGGEFPVPNPNGGPDAPIEYKEYGTRVDCMATLLSDGRIRLEAHPRVSEVLEGQSIMVGDTKVPAISVRQIDTAVELKSGETVLLAGLVQKRAIPKPAAEPADSSEQPPSTEEIELVVMMKCELFEPLGLSRHDQKGETAASQPR